jgi:hypothetical protein
MTSIELGVPAVKLAVVSAAAAVPPATFRNSRLLEWENGDIVFS